MSPGTEAEEEEKKKETTIRKDGKQEDRTTRCKENKTRKRKEGQKKNKHRDHTVYSVKQECLMNLHKADTVYLAQDDLRKSIEFPLRKRSKRSLSDFQKLEPWESMACGALAGATSGALTIPLDVIKTRLMAYKHNPSLPSSMRAVAVDIIAREGLLGLAAGLRERAIYIALGSAIFWTMFEQVSLECMSSLFVWQSRACMDGADCSKAWHSNKECNRITLCFLAC